MKRGIVRGLLYACKALDTVPRVFRWSGRWYVSAGCWGCDLGLADLSLRLDDRWGTGVWA